MAAALSSCGPQIVTKDWHSPNPILEPAEPWSPMVAPKVVEFEEVKRIRIGDPGERIHETTQPSYPAYWKEGAAVRTRIEGEPFEVAFLYNNPDGSIRDISYKVIAP